MSATCTDSLTRAEGAYAHLASFQRGDLVDVEGRQVRYPAVVMTPQQHDWADINRTYLIVSNHGTEIRITVGSLLAGHHAITLRTRSHADLMANLDRLVPARTAPLPGTPDSCTSCGHIPDTCADMCCA
jgi:hypothetical protein